MMTNIGVEVPNGCLSGYFGALIGKIYKILPMREDGAEFLQQYVDRKIREMLSYRRLIASAGEDPDFMALLLLMYAVSDPNNSIDSVKHDVFEAINLCKVLQHRYSEKGVSPDD